MAFAILSVLPHLIASRMVLDLIIHIAIFGLFATAVNLLIGYTGLISFGHAMFYASGAYGFGLLMQHGGWSVPAALAVSVFGSALLALIVGLVCTKTKEIYFTFLTLAIQMMFYSTILSWQTLTGGDQGLTGGFTKPLFLGIDLSNANQLYYFITGIVILSLGVLWHITKSPFGYALRMIRDNAARVEFLGMNVRNYRLAAFVIAAAFASVAGALMSLYVSAAYPNFGYWTMSGEAIFMIMLGGVNSFLGPLMGATMLTLLNHFVTEHTKFYGLVLGTIILLYVMFLRKGLLDLIMERWIAARDKRSARRLP
ncbi:branched-chain amino acid ABC transporter permease [Glaciimonas immobilis]|uniref:Branched-chain amino acid transport system permease protein n=1 Tax=Glaciimonas immobilis TaxID=728004 RepID=A0A840RWA6_9BURK|nr:branched-chain amino acid ABC transporter permease [Glaciimonas immobilis]MBB5201156.1 branched-chain amino acid transport system permease protein [Glaciimonas immobilis]